MPEPLGETYEAIRWRAAWRLVAREGASVSGPGALAWLQGQVSQDLGRLAEGTGGSDPSVETLVLSPQGKIESYCRVTSVGPDRYLLDVRAGFGEALYERLRRFKLRVKADLEPVERLSSIEVRGPETPPPDALRAWAAPLSVAVVEVAWPGLSGRDVLFLEGDAGALVERRRPPGATGPGDDEAFEAARIEAGLPELGLELTERTIPQEAGDLVAHAVSFSKGCYTGQELVARVDSRGSNTPRRLRRLEIRGLPGGPPRPARGDELLVAGVAVGELTSVAWSPGAGRYVALASVKRGTPDDAEAEVATRDGPAQAVICSLPAPERVDPV